MDTPVISADFSATVSFEGVDACGVVTIVTPSTITGGNTVTFKLTPRPVNGITLFPLDTDSRDAIGSNNDTTFNGTWATSKTYKYAYRQRYNL